MRLSSVEHGSALHSFANNLNAAHQEFAPKFAQGCLSFTLDQLVYEQHLGCPTYLKIDVDGLESKIIEGAQKLLQDPKLRSVLIEVNNMLEVDRQTIDAILVAGFSIQEKGEPARAEGQENLNIILNRK
jgi:hypothetical protein